MAKSRNFPHSLSPCSPLPLPCHLHCRDFGKASLLSMAPFTSSLSLSSAPSLSLSFSLSKTHAFSHFPSLTATSRSKASYCQRAARASQLRLDGTEMSAPELTPAQPLSFVLDVTRDGHRPPLLRRSFAQSWTAFQRVF